MAEHALALRIAAMQVPMRDGAAVSMVTMEEAAYRREAASAVGGHRLHKQDMLRRIAGARAAEQARCDEDHGDWALIKAHFTRKFAEARKAGLPPPTGLPHPDDIILNPGQATVIVGPLDQDHLRRIEYACDLRDHLSLQSVFDLRSRQKSGRATKSTDTMPMSAVLAMALNTVLPIRFRMTPQAAYEREIGWLICFTMAELMDEIRLQRRQLNMTALGAPRPMQQIPVVIADKMMRALAIAWNSKR